MTTAKATTKVGVSKVKGAAQKIPTLNLYPYAPQHQLAGVNAGIVPYNTVNSVGLRDQLISKAQKVSNTSRAPFTGQSISVPWLSDKYNAVEIKGKVKAKGKIKDIDRRVYTLKDLDLNQITRKGETNIELMKKGKAPYAKDGTKINLHHLIQDEPGSMVEIPGSLHQARI
nr:HNH/ENDO VII family nuclease [Rummeliibacillus suwonensis]